MRKNYTEKELVSLLKKHIEKDTMTTDVTGMAVHLRPVTNGTSIIFKLRQNFNYKRYTYTLGIYPTVSLNEARSKYLHYLSLLEKGIDPENNIKPLSVTFGALWQEWTALTFPKLSENTIQKYQSMFKIHLYRMANEPVDKITPNYMIDYLNDLIKRGSYGVAQRIAANVRALLDYAVFKQVLPYNPLTKISKYLPKPQTQHLKSFADDTLESDMIQLFEDIKGEKTENQLLIYMYFFTLLRSVELRRLRIEDIKDNYFSVKTKTMAEFKVPVTKQMQRVIDYMKFNHRGCFNKYLFEGEAEDGIVSENTVNKILTRLGYKDKLRVHGIRSCGRQWMQTLPYAKESMIEMCLSHVPGNKVVQAYNRGTYLEERREIMIAWNDFVEKCAMANFSSLFGEQDTL